MRVKWWGLWLLALCGHAGAADFAITMDDFNVGEATLLTAPQRSERILQVLAQHHAQAALFVVCRNLETVQGRDLLADWGRAGHLIGNHTYTHPRYGARITYEDFSAEAARCDGVLKGYRGFQPLFRFPQLAEGDTPQKRDLMRAWLRTHGYRNAAVTIDASDWYIDQRLREKLASDPAFDLTRFRDFYLQHMWACATYYDDLASKVVGRAVPHTLLVHFNLLNALYLGDLLAMFQSRGWRLVDASAAFADPLYARSPLGMPSGQSLIWGLAKESGNFESTLRYPGEDSVYEQPAMDALGL
jgi:peptidoglycan/xylan/chitin deacetylase (PgdA/CDA1 family)